MIVSRNEHLSLLGLHDCVSWNLMKRVDKISSELTSFDDAAQEYKDIFKGLRKFQGCYHITLNDNVVSKATLIIRVPQILHKRLKKSEGI